MKNLGKGEWLLHLSAGTLLLVATSWCVVSWQQVPERALIVGESRPLDRTIAALLKSDVHRGKYRIFGPDERARSVDGLQLHFDGSASVRDVRVSADSGTIRWRNGRYDHHAVPGMVVRLQGVVEAPTGPTQKPQVLWARLPALRAVGVELQESPEMASAPDVWPRPGDSIVVEQYRVFPDSQAIGRARVPPAVGAFLFAGLFLAGAVRLGRRLLG